MGSIPGSGRSPGGGHGHPLQYSCLENPTDGGAWRAAVHGAGHNWGDLPHTHTHTLQEGSGVWPGQGWVQLSIVHSLIPRSTLITAIRLEPAFQKSPLSALPGQEHQRGGPGWEVRSPLHLPPSISQTQPHKGRWGLPNKQLWTLPQALTWDQTLKLFLKQNNILLTHTQCSV